MKNIKLISIICIFLMVISFTACKSKDIQENTNGPDKGYVEQVSPAEQEKDKVIEKLDEEVNNVSDSELTFIGKWQTDDGNFTYYILEDGKLCVGSQYGVDEDCTWSQDGDRIEFNFSDDAGITYIYDKENDKLICDGDDSWYLVRSEE